MLIYIKEGIKGEIMGKLNTYRPYIILSIFLLIAGILSIVFSAGESRIRIVPLSTFNDGWVLVQGDTEIPLDTLPTMLDIPAGESYTIKNTLTEDFHDINVMMLRTSLQNIKVEVDGSIIYEKTYQAESTLPPYASMWHFIELPAHIGEMEISMTLSSPYKAMSGTVNDVHYGSYASLYTHLFDTYGYRLFVGIFVLIAGLIMMFASLFIKKGEGIRYTYIGLFSTILSFWIIAESRMLQWFTGNEFILGSLAYLSLALFPIPLLYYLMNHVVTVYRKPYTVFIGIFYIQSILITVFQATGIADYFESVIYTQIFLIAGTVMILTTLIIEINRFKNQEAVRVTKYLGMMLVFLLMEIFNFLLGNFEYTSIFALTGVGLFMLIMLVNYIRYLLKRMKLSYEKEFYERLAYHDWMTGGKNRLKFENDIEIFFNDPELRNKLRLVYFDFDDLKKVNDVYGHLEGDRVIKKGYELINSVFGDIGSCYRIGGDEFSCLILDNDETVYAEKINKLKEDLNAFRTELSYDFRISMGTSEVHLESDDTTDQMIKRADEDMYLDKCKTKGNCNR